VVSSQRVSGNSANENSYGIYLTSLSSNNKITSNTFYDNSGYDIYNTGSGNIWQYNSYGTIY
jgi:parallel beta-helix repeat protein